MENVELHQFCNIKHGFAFKGEYISNNPTKYILLTPGNFKIGGGFKKDKLKYYNGEIPKDYVLKGNDLIVSMTDLSKNGDTLGYSALVPDSEEVTYLHNQRIGLVEITNEKLYSGFLYWLLRSYEYQRYIVGCASGSTVKHTSPTSILSYKFNLPSIGDQKKIAAILSSLDDKIELNTRMNKVLEEIARALFQRWFVEFEFPNAEGMPYKSAGGKMVESEMGMVPEGWEVGKLGDIIELSYGKPLKEENRSGNGFPVFGSNGVVGWHNEWMVAGPGIIVGRKGNAGTVTWSHENFFPIDTTFFVCPFMSIYGRYGLHFLYLLLKTLKLPHLTSDSAVPGLNRNTVLIQKLLLPNIYIVNKFELVVSSIFSQIYELELENKSLISLRDILLPKLMSGELQLPENQSSDNKLLKSELNKVVKNGF